MEKIPDKDSAIEEMIRISSTPVLFKKINFGKYKDKDIDEILKTDRQIFGMVNRRKTQSRRTRGRLDLHIATLFGVEIILTGCF